MFGVGVVMRSPDTSLKPMKYQAPQQQIVNCVEGLADKRGVRMARVSRLPELQAKTVSR